MAKHEKLTGQQKFVSYYSAIYSSRWESLNAAMIKETVTENLSQKLRQPYFMDKASVHAVSQLPVKKGQTVLDMCAAPGGKTLYIALELNGDGTLISNDRSGARRNRLIKVIDECLEDRQKSIIKVTGYDSTKWGLFQQDIYDCILLDAPCSSERHVINSPSDMALWGTNRPHVLSNTQFAMLCAAYTAVKPGGHILYSTCSINPIENQGVIKRLFERDKTNIEEIDTCGGERLEFGRIILPDTNDGHGPLFFCLIRKKSE